MKYIPFNYKLAICKRIMFLAVFLFGLLHGQAQNVVYKNGIQQGVVKVKFETSMTTALSQMQIKTKGKQLSTGISNFDKAATSIKAMKMERLIPECPNPALEAKHRKAGLHLWYVVEFDPDINPVTAVNTLKSLKEVKLVECEYAKSIAPSTASPYKSSPSTYSSLPFNDPFLKDQWHYINTGQLNLSENKADANLDAAWKVTAGRSDIIVAVQDEGVDVNHEDLKANMWINKGEIPDNGIDDDGNGYIDDIHGFNFVKLTGNIDAQPHGTHVAGTVAAVNNNGVGVSGVAGGTGKGDGAKIMSLQIIGGATAGHMFKSYVYAADMGAVISQNSWGYNSPGVWEKDVLDGIDYFIATAGDYNNSPMEGGIVIFASGNDAADDQFWPGVYEKCFSVSAVGPEWKIAAYSNYGKWVEVSAPGGDITTYLTAKAGVLSTMPGNQYGYMQGTSMACPHVSGIAALAIASSDKQLTNTELRSKLLTSITKIDKYNPMYVGKLGTGSIDAELAVRKNAGISPDKITTLAIKGIAQEFVSLEWAVPHDSDDDTPTSFNIYYATESITNDNLNKAHKLELKNDSLVGAIIPLEINGLLGTTKYYFGVISIDRWGNRSELSNIVTGTTNDGPTIDVNTGSLDKILSISTNVAQSAVASKSFQLLNRSEGVLRWESTVRNAGHTPSLTGYSLKGAPKMQLSPKGIVMQKAPEQIPVIRNTDIAAKAAFTAKEKKYIDYVSFYIGDTDPLLSTSGATKFIVTEDEGFNLTEVAVDVRYTLGTGPLVIQVYKDGLSKEKLYSEEEYQPESSWMTNHRITLKEHINFEKGAKFYIVVHVPPGNGYSLGIGTETSPDYSDLCYYSPDYGVTWAQLSNVGIGQSYAWSIVAVSKQPNISEFITLNPASGNVDGNSNETILLKADGKTLINGTYNTNVVFKSNDSKNTEYRMPVKFDIAGQKPNIVYPKIVEFGSVFKNSSSTIDILLENNGYGLIKDMNATINNSQFSIVAYPSMIDARGEAKLRVQFKPETSGNINGKLTITNGEYTYVISLFGVGAETSKIEVSPSTYTIDSVKIGDVVNSSFTISNTGGFPLKYFIPGFDDQGISKDWETKYHSYGYIVKSNDSRIGVDSSLSYEFNDISTTGVDITDEFIDSNYSTVSFGFDFPFYGVLQDKIYVTKSGFTTFDNTSQPYNVPQLEKGLKGYISLMGYNAAIDFSQGKIQYKALSDRLIIQYTHIGYTDAYFTAQMVLFANGNIRFYYKDVPLTGYNASIATILIEDLDQKDGILIRNQNSDFFLNNNTVIGFDYAGPNIIKSIEKASGIVAPGETVSVNLTMDTKSLSEGTTVRNINIINNDPLSLSKGFSTILNVTTGGVGDCIASTDTVDFGVTYKGYAYTKEFSIRNKGSKAVAISNMIFNNTKFTVSGNMTIAPGINEIYTVVPNTAAISDLEDELQINFENGSSIKLNLKASVSSVPIAITNLDPVSATLNIGEKKSYPFEIKNTGGANLEVSIIGGQWFRFEETTTTTVNKFGYHVKRENSGEPSYNWVDIVKTGTKIDVDFDAGNDKRRFWTEIELPFTFSYYGLGYDKIKAGYNGIIALGGDPDAKQFPIDVLPIKEDGAFIYPLWSPGGFDTYLHPEDAGLYYQLYDDKIVVSWVYFINLFGWGESFQAILYKDGTIKYQYKLTDGSPDGTGSGLIGIQNAGGDEFTSISNKSALPHNKGIAFVIAPENVHVVAPNSNIQGNIVLDALNIYGGTFSDKLLIKTNAPASPELEKPLSVNVLGLAKIEAPLAIDLGATEVVLSQESMTYKSLEKPLTITNSGDAPLRITNAKMKTGGKYLTQLVYVSGWLGAQWTAIEDLWGAYPEQLLLPGASFNTFVRFAPETAGTYEDILVVSTTLGDIEVKLKGFGYDSPVINVDNTPIEVSFNTPTQEESRSITFDNKDGGYKLDYDVLINYQRGQLETNANEKIATSKADTSRSSSLFTTLAKNKVAITSATENFNRKIQYVSENSINNSMGNDGLTATMVATKFVADKTGFNLSDVGTYVNITKGTSGTISVEVRVGGTNITNALPLATASINFNYNNEQQVVVKENITLENPIQILPNEEFYVIFNFPMDLTFPQTIQLGNVDLAPGRYLWFQDGSWVDLQDYLVDYDPKSGFGMYAAERNYKESGWLKIMTPDAGSLQQGEATKADIKLVGSFAQRGDQKANVVIRSSDVNASIVKIPVSLHLNEAPAFVDVPTSVMIAEKEVISIPVVVVDKEENSFTLDVIEKPAFVTSTKNADGSLILSVTPDYGDAGNHIISMKATDEYNAVNNYTINVYVAKTNRAPKYIKESNILSYDIGSASIKVDINELFEDPDGDEMTFNVTSLDNNIIEVYLSGTEYFMIEARAAGTTKLSFVVTDIHGASTTHQVDVTIESCLNPENLIVQKWNNALLVNNQDVNFISYQWFKNGSILPGAIKQYYAEATGELDFEAEYFVRLTTSDGKIVSTCPMKAIKKDISLKVYPNPVKSGQEVMIEAQLPDLGNNPLKIQVINLSGQIVKSTSSSDLKTPILLPAETGYYLIKVTSKYVEKTFKIIVE